MLWLLCGSRSAQAGESLQIGDWLARPGVRLVAVEFYATWCKPCMEAMPRWKALKEKYYKDGLRVIVVNTQDPEAGAGASDSFRTRPFAIWTGASARYLA